MAETREGKGLPTLASELWELVVTYARQETIAPIKGLGRFLAFGLAGSVLLGIGLVLLALAGLRALQTEFGRPFEGNWSWGPYAIVLVACVGVAGLAARAIGAQKRKAATKGTIS